jgi:hypothetical protein
MHGTTGNAAEKKVAEGTGGGVTMPRTRKDFFRRCREIMGSESYTEEGKKEAVDDAAEFLMENIVEGLPEIRDMRRREDAFERKHSIDKGPIYCPGCGTWSPKKPREVRDFAREWVEIKERKKAELIRKAMAGKEA